MDLPGKVGSLLLVGEGGEDFELRRLNGVASVAPREGSSIGNPYKKVVIVRE